MSMILALALGGWKHLVRFLSGLSFWQLACLALAILAVLQTYRAKDARSDAERWEKTYHGYRASQAAAAEQQKQTTATNIVKTRDRIVHIEGPARIVETAPLPGQCKTPDAVLQGDL